LEDFAEVTGIELLVIDKDNRLRGFKKELRPNTAYYSLAGGL
jgi:L-arabinose isomerase